MMRSVTTAGTKPRTGGKSAAAYRTISEVSEELDVPQHVLRFWETKFNQVRPLKRGGGRRYYRPEDVGLLRQIQKLLYQDGYTIKGVQRLLREGRSDHGASVLPATVSGVRVAGDPAREIRRVALCGGAGDSLLGHPEVIGADVYVTSDLRHHPAQESLEQSAVAGGPALIDISHWAAESLWLEGAAARLAEALPGVEFRVSERRTDVWSFAVGCDS